MHRVDHGRDLLVVQYPAIGKLGRHIALDDAAGGVVECRQPSHEEGAIPWRAS